MNEPLPLQPISSPPSRWHWLALLMIVAGGSALRFTLLNRPCLWGDESLVYWRTCGSYADLLQCLRDDGFAPLHYEAAWVLAQRFRPTPFILRLLPAICGSLTIPAIYFLARQLFDRAAALLAALLAATSAFGFFYSRDAKMYGELYLFATLYVGCLLWWLRTGRSTAWLGWVAAGCLAAGVHADGLIFPALSPLLLLTNRRPRATDALWLTLGLLVIGLGPAGYYGTFNLWNQRVDEIGWNASGLQWIDMENEGRSGGSMLRSLGTSLLIGWTYPIPSRLPIVSPRALLALQRVWAAVMAILLAGALPWPAQWRRRKDFETPVQSQWRSLLWLALLIVPVTYSFYCHSMPGFAGPPDWYALGVDATPAWLQTVLSLQAVQWIGIEAIAAAIIAGCAYRPTRARTILGLQMVAVVAAMIGVCWIIYTTLAPMAANAELASRSWHSLWVPRYLGFLWPPLVIAAAALMLRLPTRPIRIVAVALLVGVNLLMVGRRVFADTEPPVDRMAADVVAAQRAGTHVRTYVNGGRADPTPGGGDLFSNPGRYYLQLLTWKQPMSPMQFHRILYDYHFYDGYIPRTIAEEVAATPRLDHVVTWDGFPAGAKPADDPLLPLLHGWTRTGEKTWAVADYWDWKPKLTYVRREYARISTVAARPS